LSISANPIKGTDLQEQILPGTLTHKKKGGKIASFKCSRLINDNIYKKSND